MESRVQTLGLCRQQHRNIQRLQVPLLSWVLYSTCLADEAGPQAAALQTHLSHTALAWVVKTQTSAGVCGTNSILLPTHPVVSTPREQVSASSIQKLAPYGHY